MCQVHKDRLALTELLAQKALPAQRQFQLMRKTSPRLELMA